MDFGENKHCVETAWSMRYHYRKGDVHTACCGVNDNPTHVELRSSPRGYPRLDFELPRQRYDLDKVDDMLKEAYEQGRRANRVEVAKLLKALIAF